jgi:hypothetical protein
MHAHKLTIADQQVKPQQALSGLFGKMKLLILRPFDHLREVRPSPCPEALARLSAIHHPREGARSHSLKRMAFI